MMLNILDVRVVRGNVEAVADRQIAGAPR